MRLYIFILVFFPLASWSYPTTHSIGFGMGHTWTEAVFNDQIRILGNTREVPSYTNVSNSQLPWRLFYTIQYTKYYGIETGIVDFGGITFIKTLTTFDDNTSTITSESIRHAVISSQGFYLQHVLKYPIFTSAAVYGKFGVILGDTQYSEIENLSIYSEDAGTSTIEQLNESTENFIDVYISLGLEYTLNNTWYASLQLNQVQIDHQAEKESFTQWFTNGSIEYRF